MLGSSPRIRGESGEKAGSGDLIRIIPANTGRISQKARHYGSDQDHPREYGENASCHAASWRPWGSSPRIRGEFDLHISSPGGDGIIPANTGRIRGASWSQARSRDHPREYGENPSSISASLTSVGSSPRIRGESPPTGSTATVAGIIPANTGRITGRPASGAAGGDHPREYGENQLPTPRGHQQAGSSPRIRGEFYRASGV